MELEQLKSFVGYQLGQKQGWEALYEVLTVVLESKERVAAGQVEFNKLTKDIEGAKASLVAIEEAKAASLASLDKELASKQEDFETPLRNAKVALEQEIIKLDMERQGALNAAAQAVSLAQKEQEKLEQTAQAVVDNVNELQRVQKALADLKASL